MPTAARVRASLDAARFDRGADLAAGVALRCPVVPFTPFHFGPGLLGKGLAPRGWSWSAFVASTIAIDGESLYYLAQHAYPVHRRLHTFVGAAVVGVAIAGLLLLVRRALPRLDRASPTVRAEATPRGIVVGALAGALTHPVLDGLMHADIEPFQPWTAANPLRGLIELGPLHLGCVLAGVAGAILVAIAWRRDRARTQ